MADWLPLARVPELMGVAFPNVSSVPASSGSSPVLPSPHLPSQTGGSVPLPQPPAYQGNYVAQQIPTYLWHSVVALLMSAAMMMVFCLPIGMPFAVVALVYASKVEGLRMQGSLMEAESASKSAKVWMIVSYALSGLVFVGLFVVFVIFLVAAGTAVVSP